MKLALANLFSRLNRYKTALEVDEELQFHLAMLERKYMQEGMCAADAQAAALRRFGNFQRVKQQCVEITKRSTLLRRVLKTSLMLMGLAGLLISIGSSDYKVDRIGHVLIMIAIMGRLLLYVRGLGPFTYLAGVKATSITDPAKTPRN
ncbi:MAG TPA: permease prefix domain 1-containing protein [Pyrinomonadaceae bacterium]|jgi:hypothetical protein|nr:permease prefix domain 1-containing protein [Pyrinomonadaceae bacterium]